MRALNGPRSLVLAIPVLLVGTGAAHACDLLMITGDGTYNTNDAKKRTLFESWGFTVTVLEDAASSGVLLPAANAADIVYVSETTYSDDLGTKIRTTTTGVVVEEGYNYDSFGLTSGDSDDWNGTQMTVTDNTHPITNGLSTGTVTFASSSQPLRSVENTLGSGVTVLATRTGGGLPVVTYLDAGDTMSGGGAAAGRRVSLPYASSDFDPDALTSDGVLLLRNAVFWAAGNITCGGSMLAHWKLDEASGTIAADATGNGHNGTLVDGPVWLPSGGQIIGGLYFDGIDDVVDVTGTFSEPAAVTIAGWIKTDASSNGEVLSIGDAVALRISSTGVAQGFFHDGSTWQFTNGGSGLNDDTWHHVAYVFDANNDEQHIYVDGSLTSSSSLTSSINYSGLGSATTIGTHGNGSGGFEFEGALDDIRLYDYPLSASEIAAVAAAPIRYVRTTGSNGNNGLTPATAWRTVDYAADQSSPGYIIYVGAGTYNEEINPSSDGTADEWITLIADTEGSRTGDAGTVTLTSSSDVITLNDDDYFEFRGFAIDAGGQNCADIDDCDGASFIDCDMFDASYDSISVDDSVVTLTNCTLRDSTTYSGLYVNSDSTVDVISCIITGNNDDGIYINNDGDNVVNVSECTIAGNTSDGIRHRNGALNVTNSLISLSTDDGIESNSGTATIWHCTIVDNNSDGIDRAGGTMTVTNSIIAFNDDDNLQGSMTNTYNIVFGAGDDNFNSTSQGSNTLVTDPLFVSTNDYHVSTVSPAIDAGTSASSVTSIDLEGNSRPQDAGWDIGCYEGGQVSMVVYIDVSSAMAFNVQTASSDLSGFHWADYDNDGDLDAIILGDGSSRFMRNDGAVFFASTFDSGSRDRHGSWLDIDNDGDIDFFHDMYSSSTAFFLNDGSGGLSNVGSLSLAGPSNEEGSAAADINGDGNIDLVIFAENGNWIATSSGDTPVPRFSASNSSANGMNDSGDEGNGEFVSATDVNDDGYLDFLYSYSSGKLFLSNGDGTYTHDNRGITIQTGNSAKMGTAWGDYDNDGDMDLFAPSESSSNPGYLFRNNGSTFTDVTSAADITSNADQESATWGDYDNDGDLDLYIATESGTNQFYINDGDGTFTLTNVGADITGECHDVVFMDHNMNGNLDISVIREDTTNVLLRNTRASTSYLYVRLIGIGAGGTDAACIGTRVDVYDSTGTTLLARRHHGVARGLGTDPQWVHFGGLNPAVEYMVKVHFRTGTMDVLVEPGDVSTTIGSTTINQMLTVDEADQQDYQVIQWTEVDPVN
ncbi:MAG: FG-GAP-like repeat-containing protein [Planctomycetota bacterium]